MTITITTGITELYRHDVAGISPYLSRKLANAVAGAADKSDPEEATVDDLLAYFPMRYEDRSDTKAIDELYEGIESSVVLHVRNADGYRVGRKRPKSAPPLYIFEVTAGDEKLTRKPVIVWWFISGKGAKNIVEYWRKRFARGTSFVAYGKWEWDNRRKTFSLKLAKPDEIEILPSEDDTEARAQDHETPEPKGEADKKEDLEEDLDRPEFSAVHVGRRVPVYRKLGPFKTKRLREIVFDVLGKIDPASIEDRLSKSTLKRLKLISRADAIKQIHFPPEDADLRKYSSFRSEAHRRLIFEEFFWVSFALQILRSDRREEKKGNLIKVSEATRKRISDRLPFKLTGAQQKVVDEIFRDLESESPMNRLVQGDVGSGKTIVAFISILAALEAGFQAALMAPTEILAEQHFRNAREFFAETDQNVDLLIGGLKASEKKKVKARLESGETGLVIGTHAIIQDNVEFKSLGLAVIDEQHRFGVLQRAELKERGYNPDVLVMTATPIPRSLAITVYGDLDVSIIDELPPGRTPVKTVVVGEDQRKGVYKGIEREIKAGRQVYIVYPLIDESEKLDLKAATRMYEELRDKRFGDRRVGLLHGRLKTPEKESVMSEFVSGNLDILVSTTVIEVGMDVPNASLMIIEHAERFGLSQLHQLRGRVGRGAEQSFCVLLTGDKKTVVAKERLGIMEDTGDGFRIAEKDLELRGQGEILGTRQSGVRTFRVGNIVRDFEILDAARKEAERFLEDDNEGEERRRLQCAIESDHRYKLGSIG
ncbi:MAG: ATP-dependent DNA helicase RecG [Acidobacteria bacterium]|nr:MAG: ATP-dependent DNA helicase RecG [Acidobacteriota bacterium]REK01221.1 MAG: ATP-dependent DNA helicase RecG [Acidobacteriota bacterium]REK14177.1 MAG: ATP-dependent DNA helicase RecG [Acidobacteriota bacterium]REK44892.1 MAG: ATP-dependent DNA helicase RecG [Acidobacteriota bacterium]